MLCSMQECEFERVFEIMREAFPVDERRTFDEQKNVLKNPLFDTLVYMDDGVIKGFITVYSFDGFCFIEHFAVASEYRNEGLGAKILQELLACGRKTCLEVELPKTEQAKRRIAFYERNGFYLNEYPYIQPPISQNTLPLPLLIMTSERKIDQREFLSIKNILYRNVYHVDENYNVDIDLQ